MANKCPKTLGNKGLSGILCFSENTFAIHKDKSAKRNSRRWVSSKNSMLWFLLLKTKSKCSTSSLKRNHNKMV